MRFSELLVSAGLPACRRGGNTEVADVQIDSRRCRQGSCFVAVRGYRDDGHKYIPAAISAGAAAVVCEDASAAEQAGACAVVADTHGAAGPLAQAICDWPVRRLVCIGVTGTNGKTTVAHVIRSVLEAVGFQAALLSTILYETGLDSRPAVTTTPDPVSLARMAADMIAAGKTHLVMEVSSHALDQSRTAGLDFRLAVYTNLSGDHLDYHGDMESYLAAKVRLFERLGPQGDAILNRDDTYAEQFAAATPAKVTWYGLSAAADVRGRIEQIDSGGSRFVMVCDGREVPASTSMIGRHNVQNCLAAAAACRALGVELPAIVEALRGVESIPGRLQRIQIDAPYSVFVDYAHTDGALRNVLGSLKPIAGGRVIVVFGCGGDRDRSKRPRMAGVAEELADRIVITSDNPRTEDPQAIIDQIILGLGPAGRAKADVEPDRRAAIALAVAQAQSGDIVLIAGKGHETYQIIGEKRLEFDDAKVAEQIVRQQEAYA